MANELLEAALEYEARGWSIFPVKPRDKEPLVLWTEFQDRRATQTEIKAWWKRWPQANIGVATGPLSGLVVVDADGEEGLVSIRKLGLPITLISRTGGGGEHRFYAYPTTVEVTNKDPQVEKVHIRGKGGFAVLPPSIHETGNVYEWAEFTEDEGIAPFPVEKFAADIFQRVHTPGQGNDDDWIARVMQGPSVGSRNPDFTRLSGKALARPPYGWGMTQRETLELIRMANSRCTDSLIDPEVVKIVESIAKREGSRDGGVLVKRSVVSGTENETSNGRRRVALLESLSEDFKTQWRRVLKYGGSPNTYVVETDLGRIDLGPIKNVTNQMLFADAYADATGLVMEGMKAPRWKELVQKILDVCEDMGNVPEASVTGLIRVWLRDYINEGVKDEEDWEDGIRIGHPFLRPKIRTTCFSVKGFNSYLRGHISLKPSELVGHLRRLGLDNPVFRTKAGPTRAWEIPDKFFEKV